MSDETVRVEKIGGYVQVSRELLGAGGFVPPNWLMVAAGLEDDPRTPEQIAADRAASEAKEAAARAECEAAHAAAIAAADGVRRAVLELHAPVWNWWGATCEGCDVGGYEPDDPEFPCRTYELARDFPKETQR